MSKLKNIFNFYIFSNIHVAFATFCLVKITLFEVGISDAIAPLFVFFSTLVSYNIIRMLRVSTIKSWFTIWYAKNRKNIYLLTSVSSAFLIYFLFQLRLKAILILAPFTLLTLFYVFPIAKFSLRERARMKLFLIAISWAGITVLFPLVQNYLILRNIDYITFLQRFLFVFAITIPFDIRDLKYDKPSLNTIPQVIGIKKSKYLAIAILFIFILLEIFKHLFFHFSFVPETLFVFILSVWLIYNVSVDKNKYYTSFFMEAIPVFWYFIIYF